MISLFSAVLPYMLTDIEVEFLKRKLRLASIAKKPFAEGGYHLLYKCKRKRFLGRFFALRVQKEYLPLTQMMKQATRLQIYSDAKASLPLLGSALLVKDDRFAKIASVYPYAQCNLHEFLMNGCGGNAKRIGISFVESIRNLAQVGLCGDVRPENALIYQGRCYFQDFDVCYDNEIFKNKEMDKAAREYLMLAQMSASLTQQQTKYNASKLQVIFNMIDTAGIKLKQILNYQQYPWDALMKDKLMKGYLIYSPYEYKPLQLSDPLPYLGKITNHHATFNHTRI